MTDRELADMLTKSAGYKMFAGKTDKAKVEAARLGERRPSPSNREAYVAWELFLREPPPQPPQPSIQELGRNVMFTAWDPAVVSRHVLPSGWKIALSADPAFDREVREAAPALAEHHTLAVWGVQTQVGVERIQQLASDVNASFTILQAEDPEQYNSARAANAPIVIGNPNNWTPNQRDDAITLGDEFTTMFEVYSNSGSPWPDTASSRGVPVCCEVLGVGSWNDGPNLQLTDYFPHTPGGVWATMSVYLAEDMDDLSWSLLPPAVQ